MEPPGEQPAERFQNLVNRRRLPVGRDAVGTDTYVAYNFWSNPLMGSVHQVGRRGQS